MTAEKIQAQIKKEMRQALINTWCLSHDIDPRTVTYENGKICIPFDL